MVLSALEALGAVHAGDVVPSELLDRVLDDASAHTSRALSARASLADGKGSLQRALDDEIELARRLVVAVLVLRHGDRVRDAVRTVDRAEGQRRALGVEALDVLLSRHEAAIAVPLVSRDLRSPAAREVVAYGGSRAPGEWIDDMARDPDGVWRSSWLAACARHEAGD